MRVAYVCADPGVPVFGRKGCSIHVQEVVRAFQQEGAEVELFATRAEGPPPADLAGAVLHRLGSPGRGDLAARETALLSANEGLQALLWQRGPFDLVYERYALWSFAAMEYARQIGTPAVLEVNAPLIEEQAQHRGLIDRTGAAQATQRALAAATSVVAVSQEVATYLRGFAAEELCIHVVPNGVNPDRFPARLAARYNGETGTFTVGFLGTLKPWHGLGTLVEAFALLHQRDRSYRLRIVGDGPQREPLQAELVARGVMDAVELAGAVAAEEVPRRLASFDVAVAPYPSLSDFYFSPLKVVEYMAAGRPVVASGIGQLPTLIDHGRTGLLCPPGDAAALAAAVDRLRSDAPLREQLGRSARAHVLQNHTWQKVVQRVFEIVGKSPVAGGLPL